MEVLPEAEVVGRDAPPCLDGSRLDDDQAEAERGAGAIVREVPVAGDAVPGRLLAHGGHHDAVAEIKVPETEG